MDQKRIHSNKNRYISFFSELMDAIEDLFDNNISNIHKARTTKLEPIISKTIRSFANQPKFESFDLVINKITDFGSNLLFQSEIGEYSLPSLLFLTGNWKQAISDCKSTLINSNDNISWENIQNQIYKTIISTGKTKASFSIQLLEQMRLVLSILSKSPESFTFHNPIPVDITTNSLYYSMFTNWKPMTIYETIKTYLLERKSLRTQFNFSSIPHPGYWDLDILIISQDQFTKLPNDFQIPNSPVGFVYDGNKEPLFGFYWVQTNYFAKKNLLRLNLVKKLHFSISLNKNQFILDSRYNIYRPQLTPIDQYKEIWKKSITARIKSIDPIIDQFGKSNRLEFGIYYPNWELILDTGSFIPEEYLDDGLLDYRNKKLIRFFNSRNHFPQQWDNYYLDLDQEDVKRLLFPDRIFIPKIGYSSDISQIIIYLKAITGYEKLINKAVLILKLFLLDAIFYECAKTLIVLTRLPSTQLKSRSFLAKIKVFFEDAHLECHIFTKDSYSITPFSYYYFPESKYFIEEYRKWDLPMNGILMTENQKHYFIQDLIRQDYQKYLEQSKIM